MYPEMYPRLSARFTASAAAANYTYIYTDDPDATGREGFSLVRVREEDGREVGRAWVEQREPKFVLDPIGELVFFWYSSWVWGTVRVLRRCVRVMLLRLALRSP